MNRILKLKPIIQNFLLKLSENSIFFYNCSQKVYNWIYHLFCWYISKNENNIDSIIPVGSYSTGDFIPWKSDIDISIIVRYGKGIHFTHVQKRLYRKTKIFSSIFQIIKHIHVIPKHMLPSGLFSLVPPFFLITSEENKLYKLHIIICIEEYFDRIFFSLSSKNSKYLFSARNFLKRKKNIITHEFITKWFLLSRLKTDLEIVIHKDEKNLFENKLTTLRKKFSSEAFFITYHHSYLTTEIWTMFLLPNKTLHREKIVTLINEPPFIKNILNFIPFKYLPYLKNIIHTKFICYFYGIQPSLLNYISTHTQPIPSLLDEILILYNFLRTLTEPLDFPYGINFDRYLNDIHSYRTEHFRAILFAFLNFQSYIQNKKYFLSPQSIVMEEEYKKYNEFLDPRIDYGKLIEAIYQKRENLLTQIEEFFKNARFNHLLQQLDKL